MCHVMLPFSLTSVYTLALYLVHTQQEEDAIVVNMYCAIKEKKINMYIYILENVK